MAESSVASDVSMDHLDQVKQILDTVSNKVQQLKFHLSEAKQARQRLMLVLDETVQIENILTEKLKEELEKEESLQLELNMLLDCPISDSSLTNSMILDQSRDVSVPVTENSCNTVEGQASISDISKSVSCSNEVRMGAMLDSAQNNSIRESSTEEKSSFCSSKSNNFLPLAVRKYLSSGKYKGLGYNARKPWKQASIGTRGFSMSIDKSLVRHELPAKPHYLCLMCNKSFETLIERRKHEREEHHTAGRLIHRPQKRQKKLFHCPVCGEAFNMCHDMQRHAREEHYSKDPNICDECGKSFVNRFNLKAHKRLHSDLKPFECSVCSKRFKTKGQLTKHNYVHTGEKRHKCEVCDEWFTHTFQLRVHMTSHTGERPPYVCSECAYECHFRGSLVKHMRTHTGEKPFLCSECGKSFADPSAHKTHLLMHSGQRPYSCSLCNKTFRLKGQLNLHQRVHTGEKRYVCMVCGARYMYSKGLRDHAEKHAGAVPALGCYTCSECGVGFNSETELLRHINSHVRHDGSEVMEYFIEGSF